ncbi:MAG: TrkA family potassium uptake protein [Clostridia bacterium]|nr:TrkA family potassium uptake protein [Clostridia bacterium]
MPVPKEYAVIGLGRFGSAVARTLVGLGHSVLGIDEDAHKVQTLSEEITHVVQADATDEHTLRSLGLRNFDTVVVGIGHDMEASILVTLLLKEMGVRFVVAKASSETHGKVLARVGADRVVFPEKDMGVKVARGLVETNVLDYIEVTPEVSIVELTVNERLSGKTLRELDLRARFGVTVLAVKHGKGDIRISPPADEPLRTGDVLIAIGENEAIERLHQYQERQARR